MKKFSFLLFLIAVGAISCNSATVRPSANEVNRNFAVQPFDELSISSAFQVVYQQSADDTYKVQVTVPDNLVEYVKVTNHDNKVTIGLKPGTKIEGKTRLKAVVMSPYLTEIDLDGASALTSRSIDVSGRKLDVELNGASSFNVDNLVALTADFDVKGASTVKVPAINANKVEADATGASTLTLGGIDAKDVSADASGASSITLKGRTHHAEYEASGASTISASALLAELGECEAKGASNINAMIRTVTERKAYGGSKVTVTNP